MCHFRAYRDVARYPQLHGEEAPQAHTRLSTATINNTILSFVINSLFFHCKSNIFFLH